MLDRLRDLADRTLMRLSGRYARSRKRKVWEQRWSREGYDPPWGGRGISPEIEAAVRDGWLPPEGAVLDVGCGLGEIAAWFAERGHVAVGVDIAEAAVERARRRHAHLERPPEFLALDLTAEPAPDLRYRIVIDRGCFHQLPDADTAPFLAHLLSVSAPDARLLLFVRAFRGDIPLGDPRERRLQEQKVRDVFCPAFAIDRVEETYIDRYLGKVPGKALPGIVFWMSRAPA